MKDPLKIAAEGEMTVKPRDALKAAKMGLEMAATAGHYDGPDAYTAFVHYSFCAVANALIAERAEVERLKKKLADVTDDAREIERHHIHMMNCMPKGPMGD